MLLDIAVLLLRVILTMVPSSLFPPEFSLVALDRAGVVESRAAAGDAQASRWDRPLRTSRLNFRGSRVGVP